jgi:hypothetical protein
VSAKEVKPNLKAILEGAEVRKDAALAEMVRRQSVARLEAPRCQVAANNPDLTVEEVCHLAGFSRSSDCLDPHQRRVLASGS